MSRAGFSNNTSPLLKMSYETSVKFLADAAFTGEFDRMATASAQICLGKPVTFGSGMVDVRYDTNFKHTPVVSGFTPATDEDSD